MVRAYPRCKLDAYVVHTGSYVYLQPLSKGDFMEMGIADGLYVNTEGEKSVYVRWLWRADGVTHPLKDCHAKEVFLSNCWDMFSITAIEGCEIC